VLATCEACSHEAVVPADRLPDALPVQHRPPALLKLRLAPDQDGTLLADDAAGIAPP
jgi:hypothetical protein